MSSARRFETRFGVYFDDLDPLGVLHNARYLLLFERAIGEFWRHLGWGGILDMQANPDQYHMVRLNHIEYLRPVVGMRDVCVRLGLARLGRTSLTFCGTFVPPEDGQAAPYARAVRVFVRVDPETHRPAPWTDDVRRQLTPWVDEDAGRWWFARYRHSRQ